MKSLCVTLLTAFAAVAFFGCAAPAGNTNTTSANVNSTSSTMATPAPATVEALKELESNAFDAFGRKDANFFEGFLTSTFVESWHGQRLDRATAIKAIGDHNCEIKRFSLSDEKLTKVGADTAIITMMVTADGTCQGEKIAPFISATLFARTGNEWKAAWHGEVTVVDPKAPAKARTAAG
jgi:hypothetical protein